MRYDIAVIGNDEAAFEMLTLAAASGKRSVAIIPEVRHSSWLVSQALRRLITNLLVERTPSRKRMFANTGSPRLLQSLIARSIVSELTDQVNGLRERNVDVVIGETDFVNCNELRVVGLEKETRKSIQADTIVVGTGVRRCPLHRPASVRRFFGPEKIFHSRLLPSDLCIIGGGQFGAGLASLTSLFGTNTRHVARNDQASVMQELCAASGVTIGHHPADVGLPSLSSDGNNTGFPIVDCRRSIGFTDHLNLESVFVEPDENGQLWCAANFETWATGVFGVGSVVGFSPDTALHPSIQAERVMSQMSRRVKRPKMLDRKPGAQSFSAK